MHAIILVGLRAFRDPEGDCKEIPDLDRLSVEFPNNYPPTLMVIFRSSDS